MNKQETISSQIGNHSVAIISLIIAITALVYTTWRDEETERNRNTRTAGFEVLKNLGELQLIVNNAHYQQKNEANILLGWGRIALIGDLADLLPPQASEQAQHLVDSWKANVSSLNTEENVDKLTQQIDQTRLAIVNSLKNLK